VPEEVTGALLADLRGLDRARDPVAQIVRVEPFAVATDKQGLLANLKQQLGPC